MTELMSLDVAKCSQMSKLSLFKNNWRKTFINALLIENLAQKYIINAYKICFLQNKIKVCFGWKYANKSQSKHNLYFVVRDISSLILFKMENSQYSSFTKY